MPKMTIDGTEIEIEAGLSVLQACELAGKEIPRFCYHERLSISGNCRMCLVEMERAPKPIASCAMPVAEGMVINTDSEAVRKARQGVMEFLLINHPLDCPICDQGGECDLQDQAIGYGFDRSRFGEIKRSVADKNLGPLIKTSMSRCIHCTRCVRFAGEIAGVPEMGATGRGEDTEIGTYVQKTLSSELSGNLIDLCPVGALTSKPYAFLARPWELKKTETIDVLDALGSAIRVDARGPEVMRVLPRINEDVNEEWISDKTRFACDGLKNQRLDRPYVRRGGRLEAVEWPEAFAAIADKAGTLEGAGMAAIAGDLVDCESMFALKELMAALGSPNLDCRQDGSSIGSGARAGYLFNSTIPGIDQADALLIVGSNPRLAAPVLNARIRGRYLVGGFPVGLIGVAADLTYDYQYLGPEPDALAPILAGEHPFAEILEQAERPMVILGAGVQCRPDGEAILHAISAMVEKFGLVSAEWNGFNLLHDAAARVGGLDMGFLPGAGGRDLAGILAGAESGEIGLVYLLGADEIAVDRLGKAFVVYQGHHGDGGAERADVVLPGAAYTEKSGTYVNTEGRVQQGQRAVFPPGEAREDWAIIRALSEILDHKLAYDSLSDLRQAMAQAHPVLGGGEGSITQAEWAALGSPGTIGSEPFAQPAVNFYLTDPICRASATMARCAAAGSADQRKTGTDG